MGLQQTVDKWIAQSKGRPGGSGGVAPHVASGGTAYVEADFEVDEYLVNGITSSFEDVLVEDSNYGGFVADFRDGGIVIAPSVSPSLHTDIASVVTTGSFTMLLVFSSTDPEFGSVGIENYDFNFNSDVNVEVTREDSIINYSGGSVPGVAFMDEGSARQYLAVRVTPSTTAFSLNGSAVVTATLDDAVTVRDLVGFFGDCILHQLRIFNITKTNAELVALTG